MLTLPTDTTIVSLQVFSAYDLSSVEALVRYFHEAAGLPVQNTWLSTIKFGDYSSCPGITYANAAKLCPSSDETIMGNIAQSKKGLRSKKN